MFLSRATRPFRSAPPSYNGGTFLSTPPFHFRFFGVADPIILPPIRVFVNPRFLVGGWIHLLRFRTSVSSLFDNKNFNEQVRQGQLFCFGREHCKTEKTFCQETGKLFLFARGFFAFPHRPFIITEKRVFVK